MTALCEQPNLHSIDHCIHALSAILPKASATEQVNLFAATGRILSQELTAQVTVPQWDNSAMDGYALNSQDLAQSFSLNVAFTIAAGDNPNQKLPAGQCVRIYTGAPIPQGADTVIPQENCEREGDTVHFSQAKAGQNIRRQGEESQVGELLLSAGTFLRAQEIGLLASQGYGQVPVFKPLRIGLISSGNELCAPGQALQAGQIYDANRYTLHSLLSQWGFSLTHYPNLKDDLGETREALQKASLEQDIILTSGGVSVSEADHLKTAIQELGELNLWKVAIQPGKPLAFGRIGEAAWLGLPGNPAASLVTALIIARPALFKAQGRAHYQVPSQRANANFNLDKTSIRQRYLQAQLNDQGQIDIHPKQSSAMLANASWAQGLAVIPAHSTVAIGDELEFIAY